MILVIWASITTMGVQRNEGDVSCSLGGYHTTMWVEDSDKEGSVSFSGYHTTMGFKLKRKDGAWCHITIS